MHVMEGFTFANSKHTTSDIYIYIHIHIQGLVVVMESSTAQLVFFCFFAL